MKYSQHECNNARGPRRAPKGVGLQPVKMRIDPLTRAELRTLAIGANCSESMMAATIFREGLAARKNKSNLGIAP